MKALKRIKKLFKMARESVKPGRYIEIAKRISKRTRTRIPKSLKKQVCKGCGGLLVPGSTSKVRTRSGKLKIICKKCGKARITPLGKKQ